MHHWIHLNNNFLFFKVKNKPLQIKSFPSPEYIEDQLDNTKVLEQELSDYFDHCRYECKICGVISVNPSMAGKHISKQHQLTKLTYEKYYGDKMTFCAEIKCQLCDSTFKRDKFSVTCHLRQKHKDEVQSLAEYYVKYCKNKDSNAKSVEITKKAPTKKVETCNLSPPEIIQEKRVPLVQLDGNMKEHIDKTVQAQKSRTLSNTNFLSEEIQMYFNHCIYKCTICDERFPESGLAEHHIDRDHQRRNPESFTQRVKLAYHECKICKKNVLRSMSNMSQHLQKIHSTDVQTYFDDYIKEDTTSGFFDACEYACALCDHVTNSRFKVCFELLLHFLHLKFKSSFILGHQSC